MKVKVLIDDWYNVAGGIAWGKAGDVFEITDAPYAERLLSDGFVARVLAPAVLPEPVPVEPIAKPRLKRG